MVRHTKRTVGLGGVLLAGVTLTFAVLAGLGADSSVAGVPKSESGRRIGKGGERGRSEGLDPARGRGVRATELLRKSVELERRWRKECEDEEDRLRREARRIERQIGRLRKDLAAMMTRCKEAAKARNHKERQCTEKEMAKLRKLLTGLDRERRAWLKKSKDFELLIVPNRTDHYIRTSFSRMRREEKRQPVRDGETIGKKIRATFGGGEALKLADRILTASQPERADYEEPVRALMAMWERSLALRTEGERLLRLAHEEDGRRAAAVEVQERAVEGKEGEQGAGEGKEAVRGG